MVEKNGNPLELVQPMQDPKSTPELKQDPKPASAQEPTLENKETDNSQPHPGDVAEGILGEIIKQEHRLTSKKIIDPRFELMNNVYPLMRVMCNALVNFIEMVDTDLYDNNDDDDDDGDDGDEALEESMKKTLDMCDKIEALKKEVEECKDLTLKAKLQSSLDDLIEWSRNIKEQAKRIEDANKPPEVYLDDSGKEVKLVDEDPKE